MDSGWYYCWISVVLPEKTCEIDINGKLNFKKYTTADEDNNRRQYGLYNHHQQEQKRTTITTRW